MDDAITDAPLTYAPSTDSATDAVSAVEAAEAVILGSRAVLGIVARSTEEALSRVTLLELRMLVVLTTAAGPTGGVAGGIRNGELARRLRTTPDRIVDAVESLQPAHLVVAGEPAADWESQCVRITPFGRAIVDGAATRRRSELGTLLSSLPADQLRLLRDAFTVFADAAGEPESEDLLILGL
ncbi:hypothetical protein [Herbiconiux liukaitaii]|uniref:hypothetical protein n=1 Tax=Herbiconiux liukaitaii TaxID=3342799 RepID=UPI0035B6C535